MKKYLIVTSFVFAFALLSSSFVSPVLAQGTIGGGIDDTQEPGVVGQLLTKLGNGSLGSSFLIPSFQLAPKQFSNGSLGTTPLSWFNTAKNITFRVFGTSFFNNIVAYQDTLIHRLTVGSVSSAPADAPLRVDGYIRIDSLADPSADPYVPACVNDFGRIERCSTTTPPDDPTPINGVCGPSHKGSFSEAPTEGLCLITGSMPGVITEGNLFKWSCTGQLGGSSANCWANKVTTTYHWDWSPWGTCTGGVGSCQGPSAHYKVDWAGNSFEWVNGRVYSTPAQAQNFYQCAPETPLGRDVNVGTNMDFNPMGAGACIREVGGFWGSLYYEPSINNGVWHRVEVTPGQGSDNPGGGPSTPGYVNSVVGSVPLYSDTICAYYNYSEQDCTDPFYTNNLCTWNVTGASQTRTAICKDNQGNQVPENLCPQPKPQAQSQSC